MTVAKLAPPRSDRAGFPPREKLWLVLRAGKGHSHAEAFPFPPSASLYKAPMAVLGQDTTMADHHATWARIVEMARTQFPNNEPAVQAFVVVYYWVYQRRSGMVNG
jgi:hypothetical protein